MSTPANKRQKTEDNTYGNYDLIYWPGFPGRGEFVRLALEEAGAHYTETPREDDGITAVTGQISEDNTGDASSPPPLAPPILKHGDVVLSQTSNILAYLGPRLNLVPSSTEDAAGIYHVNALTLTALDGLCNEPHDVHHPVAVSKYYEDQKDEALRKAEDYRKNRLPKFLGYFERVLSGPASCGGEFLYGGRLTYADLVLFQALDGVTLAFPHRVRSLRSSGKYDKVFALYERVRARDRIKAYLDSDRRQKYGMGIYRHYTELDHE